jgi:hypothetical protein
MAVTWRAICNTKRTMVAVPSLHVSIDAALPPGDPQEATARQAPRFRFVFYQEHFPPVGPHIRQSKPPEREKPTTGRKLHNRPCLAAPFLADPTAAAHTSPEGHNWTPRARRFVSLNSTASSGDQRLIESSLVLSYPRPIAAMSKMSYYAACLEELGGAENATDRALLRCVTTALETGQHDDAVKTKDMLLVYASALVFFMQAGFAMVCAGAVRQKNVQNTSTFVLFMVSRSSSNESRNAIVHRATICC